MLICLQWPGPGTTFLRPMCLLIYDPALSHWTWFSFLLDINNSYFSFQFYSLPFLLNIYFLPACHFRLLWLSPDVLHLCSINLPVYLVCFPCSVCRVPASCFPVFDSLLLLFFRLLPESFFFFATPPSHGLLGLAWFILISVYWILCFSKKSF